MKKRTRLLSISELMIVLTAFSGCNGETETVNISSLIQSPPESKPSPEPSPLANVRNQGQPAVAHYNNSGSTWNHILLYHYLFSSINQSQPRNLPNRFNFDDNKDSERPHAYSGGGFLRTYSHSGSSYSGGGGRAATISRGGFGSIGHGFGASS